MDERKKQNYLTGAAILAATVAITKVIGMIYKIPLYNMLGDEGTSHFSVAYTIYNLLLSISTAGINIAISRLVSASAALNRDRQVRRIYKVALPTFAFIGLACMLIMLIFPQQLANFMEDHEIAVAIQVLGPAVLFCCIIAVLRGYSQGLGDMVPTALSQFLEVLGKLCIGLPVAWILLKRGSGTPAIAAGAISGVTIGLAIAIPVLFKYKRKLDVGLHPERDPVAPTPRIDTLKRLLSVSIPITIGSSLLNIISLIDTKLILLRLQSGADFSYETAKILYGVFSKGQTLFNLPSAFIVPVSVSVVPAIAAAVAGKKWLESKRVMESSLKLGNLIAMPAGIGLCVLAYPIFNVLYWGSNENGPVLLAIMGIASYFVCTQIMTTAILQANGFERFTVFTLPIGGIVKMLFSWFAVGSASINILGAPIGTLVCYALITAMNLIHIIRKVPNRPALGSAFLKPLLCSAVMGAAAWAVYNLMYKLLSGALGSGRFALAVYMCVAILAAMVVYLVLIVATRTVTREDMKIMPKGEKIANLLRLR